VLEQTKATRLIKDGDRVTGIKASSQEFGDLELTAPVVIDASGRDCFAAHKENWMVRDPELKKVALWTYYKGCEKRTRIG
jgi:flavin-dependent dehydrogenase